MIRTKEDLRLCLEHDISRTYKHRKPTLLDRFLHNEIYYIWQYHKVLRKLEYYQNNKNSIINKAMWLLYLRKHKILSIKTGLFLHPNTIDSGLYIPHLGQILISKDAKIGKNFTVRPGCVIGNLKDHEKGAAIIDDNVELSLGVKMFGPIKVGRGAIINANSTVMTNIPPYAIATGNPAKVIGFSMEPEQIIEYEKNNYTEGERIPLKKLQNNYQKYYLKKLKDITKYITF